MLNQSVSESEHTLNGTSLQFGYTVPFTSVHHTCWKIRDRRQSKKRTLQKLKPAQKKQTTQKHTKTKLAWLSRFILHSAS